MDRDRFIQVLQEAAAARGCTVHDVSFDDDDNVFDVTIDRQGGSGDVDIEDCEYVHRAVLAAFDRDVEDYSLTVGSVGLSPEEADEILKTMK